jgi:Bacterial Ig domain/PKD domain
MQTMLRPSGMFLVSFSLLLSGLNQNSHAANGTLMGWNNLGMHCMDSDYSVFSILPPYNTINAQLIHQGLLWTNLTGVTVTYEAVADAEGSINSTSVGKGNFWDYVLPLYGVAPALDAGLAGFAMPGTSNQVMVFQSDLNQFHAEGIPLTPYDDAGHKNAYPLFRLVARNGANLVLATATIVLPISDEMDCRACHASGSGPDARPAAGWVWDCNRERDYRLNILRLHDERFLGLPLYEGALAQNQYNPAGLYATVATNGTPILCARCHLSEALPGTGLPGIPPLTRSVHGAHAFVIDPFTGLELESSANRASCYRCHPGAETRCLRGAMGNAVGSDGSRSIQCQSCHGSMSQVAAIQRVGWLDEPNCQACHTGTATSNNGQIRYTSAFDAPGHLRVPVNTTFATNPDTPAPGFSLFRFSSGHGGLQCEACHGSTHAIFPSSHANDNVQSLDLQGHVGMLVDCLACHTTQPATVTGGPHGMHPVGQSWVHGHESAAEGNSAQCTVCHGADYRGTVLSRAQADRSFTVFSGTVVQFARGAQIGCYACHQGPGSDNQNPNSRPVATDAVAVTAAETPVAVALAATDANGNPLTYRIASQPQHGTVGLVGGLATYYPDSGYIGSDAFTFLASDNSIDSNPGHISLTVTQGVCVLVTTVTAPGSMAQFREVPFNGFATLSQCAAEVSYVWDFGDGAGATDRNPCHAYVAPGTYGWSLVATANGITQTNMGVIEITASPVTSVLLTITRDPDGVTLSWPCASPDFTLQSAPSLEPPIQWTTVATNAPVVSGLCAVRFPFDAAQKYFRLEPSP